MTYRHFDCIFFNVIDGNTAECLKHKKTFVNIHTIGGYQRHCDDLVLTPLGLVSHLLFAKEREKGNCNITWNETDEKAKSILNEYGFAGMKLKGVEE